ncbi:macro domain-containing protein [Nonomuraea sp. NPDC049141]|uniref:macro domain-containing protein n=1 Tax=unclassified Nonomuraea TaxID=2593643 RepID=UPI0033DB8AA4
MAALVGALAAFFPDELRSRGLIYLGILMLFTLLFACIRVWPKLKVTKHLGHPNSNITLLIGDLFAQQGHLVIGMSDTFDTEPPIIISEESVQGQFLSHFYGGNVRKLDSEIEAALGKEQVGSTELRFDKPLGKLARYPIGTVAVLGDGQRLFFCVAYAKMDNRCVVETSVHELWNSLTSLWVAVRARAHLGTVSIAVVGSGLARLSNNLSHVDLVKLISMSFLIASRQQVVAGELRIVLRPEDAAAIDIGALFNFIQSQ